MPVYEGKQVTAVPVRAASLTRPRISHLAREACQTLKRTEPQRLRPGACRRRNATSSACGGVIGTFAIGGVQGFGRAACHSLEGLGLSWQTRPGRGIAYLLQARGGAHDVWDPVGECGLSLGVAQGSRLQGRADLGAYPDVGSHAPSAGRLVTGPRFRQAPNLP